MTARDMSLERLQASGPAEIAAVLFELAGEDHVRALIELDRFAPFMSREKCRAVEAAVFELASGRRQMVHTYVEARDEGRDDDGVP